VQKGAIKDMVDTSKSCMSSRQGCLLIVWLITVCAEGGNQRQVDVSDGVTCHIRDDMCFVSFYSSTLQPHIAAVYKHMLSGLPWLLFNISIINACMLIRTVSMQAVGRFHFKQKIRKARCRTAIT